MSVFRFPFWRFSISVPILRIYYYSTLLLFSPAFKLEISFQNFQNERTVRVFSLLSSHQLNCPELLVTVHFYFSNLDAKYYPELTVSIYELYCVVKVQ